MSAPNFTPGPWVFSRGEMSRDKPTTGRFYVRGPHSEYITQRDSRYESKAKQERVAADCMLMAAAPELYEALTSALTMLEMANCETGYCCCGSPTKTHSMGDGHGPVDAGDYQLSQAVDQARAALAKARGES